MLLLVQLVDKMNTDQSIADIQADCEDVSCNLYNYLISIHL